MRFRSTALPGVVVVEPERLADARGFFARTFCAREFAAHGLPERFVQASLSFNPRRGTLRGMHFQEARSGEGKLVRCTQGRIHDVALDLRRDSPAFRRHLSLELSAENRLALYLPPGVAHGFLTLDEGCEVQYQMTEFFDPAAGRGVRFDDPAFGIVWPEAVEVVSDRDRTYPDFS